MSETPSPDVIKGLGSLWTDLQCQCVYYAENAVQADLVKRIPAAIQAGDLAGAFQVLTQIEVLGPKVDEALALSGQPGWKEASTELLGELVAEISREVKLRAAVPMPDDLEARLRKTLESLDFYDPADHVEVGLDAPKGVWFNYISKRMSPRYDGKPGDWDRDTQFQFEMWFHTGLFVVLSANTAPEFQGSGVGTRFFKAFEALARELGFQRFSVLGPNNGGYWGKVMGYTPRGTPLFTNLEAYKQTSLHNA